MKIKGFWINFKSNKVGKLGRFFKGKNLNRATKFLTTIVKMYDELRQANRFERMSTIDK